jgi:cysteine desulfurase
MSKQRIYFDHAASTPMPGEVLEVMQAAMAELYGNPSSLHEAGRRARVAIEQARRSVARCLKVTPAEVFFTSGGTEANNAILWECYLHLGVKHFISSPLEHPSVRITLEAIAGQPGAGLHLVDVDALGRVSLDHLDELARRYPGALVSLMHANNEIGNLLPVKAVAEICRDRGCLFHSDTVQTIGKFDMDLPRLGMDFAVGSAHKFHGPKGAGFMIVRQGRPSGPWMTGGSQERNMRAGTENVYGIVGLARALDWMQDSMQENRLWVGRLRNQLLLLLREELPRVGFNGDVDGSCLYGIVNLSLPASLDAVVVLVRLDMEGISVSSGSACSSGSLEPSPVIAALGGDPSRPSLRVSLGKNNTPDEVRRFVEVLRAMVEDSPA